MKGRDRNYPGKHIMPVRSLTWSKRGAPNDASTTHLVSMTPRNFGGAAQHGRDPPRFEAPRRGWGPTHCVRSRLRRELLSRPRNSEQFQPADELEMSWAMVDEYTDAGVR